MVYNRYNYVANSCPVISNKSSETLTKNTRVVKKEQPRTILGLDKKEVKSEWVAKACVVLLLIKINCIITIRD